jgi:hypothetical protein
MAGFGTVANALLKPAPLVPAMDLVGPTVDDDIRRAIGRYGGDAVKAAVRRQTKARIGRPRVNDWKELRSVIEEDARAWLGGEDPFSNRSDYSIAKAYADARPVHNHPANMKRIQRKLGNAKHGRKWFVLVTAMELSREAYSHRAHIRALEMLSEMDGHDLWGGMLERAQSDVADYATKHGAPADNLTMKEIEDGARSPLNAFLGLDGVRTGRRGLFGLLPPPNDKVLGALFPTSAKDKAGAAA